MGVQGVGFCDPSQKAQGTAAVMAENRAITINNMQEQGAAVSNLIQSSPVQSITDPRMGNNVNIEA